MDVVWVQWGPAQLNLRACAEDMIGRASIEQGFEAGCVI